MVPPGPEAQATAGPSYISYICNIELISERDVVNSRIHVRYMSLSVRLSLCLSSVCNVRASYTGD